MTTPATLMLFAGFLMLAVPLFAQRYPEHDHTVFHRPSPPPQAKHQPVSQNASNANRVPGATPAISRSSDGARRHDAGLGASAQSSEPRNTQGQK